MLQFIEIQMFDYRKLYMNLLFSLIVISLFHR